MDAVLIPTMFTAMSYKRLKFSQSIVCLEVKRTRADFLSGLKNGQYAKYADHCSGLYIVTPYGIVKPKEIPKEYGHLVVTRRFVSDGRDDYYGVCVCKRHPRWRAMELNPAQLWRILWAFMKWFSAERDVQRGRIELTRERLRNRFETMMRKVAKEIADEVGIL